MNTFGRNLRLSIFGESHGESIGCVLDGVRPGVALCEDDFIADIQRRKPGEKGTTKRIEKDVPRIMSGVYNGYTTGAPICIVFDNSNVKSNDYVNIGDIPRPGHADFPAYVKYNGFNDIRGGGHFSGRLSLALVAAGVVAKKMINISVKARIIKIGGVDYSNIDACNDLINKAIKSKDSLGGVVECVTSMLPVGLGEPFFDSVESVISHAMFSIPGVRAIEFGDGFEACNMLGSQHNDPIRLINNDIRVIKNGAGGLNGGITNGNPLLFRVGFKPTSSIGIQQDSISLSERINTDLNIVGRHDVCFALRTPVIVEAMTAFVLADFILEDGYRKKSM